MKTAVIYKSERGYTEKYAKLISERLNADIYELDMIDSTDITNYSRVIYGGGIYSDKINGIEVFTDLIGENTNKTIIVFGVGMSPIFKEYIEKLYKKNIENKLRGEAKFFFFRGGVDMKRLSSIERKVLVAFLKIVEIFQESYTEVTSNSKATDDVLDFSSPDFINDLVEYVEETSN